MFVYQQAECDSLFQSKPFRFLNVIFGNTPQGQSRGVICFLENLLKIRKRELARWAFRFVEDERNRTSAESVRQPMGPAVGIVQFEIRSLVSNGKLTHVSLKYNSVT